MKWRTAIPVLMAMLSVHAGLILRAQVQPAATGEPPQESTSDLPGDPETSLHASTIQDDSITPDEHALSGGVQPGLGSWGPRHSFWIPRVRLAQSLGSDPMLEDQGAYRGFTAAVGQVQAIQYFGRGGEVRYAGAVRFDSSATVYGANRLTNSHALGMSETRRFGEWDLTVNDQAHYWQGSLAGDSGMEGLGSVTTQLSDWAGAPGIQLDSMTLQSGVEPGSEHSLGALVAGEQHRAGRSGPTPRRAKRRDRGGLLRFAAFFHVRLDRRHPGGNAGRL